MFIFERFLGIITYIFTLLMVCILILASKKRNQGKVLFIYTIILTIMAFFFIPNSGSDLYRLVPMMNSYAQNTFQDILEYAFNSSTPLSIMYMYCIGKVRIDGLLPAITAFIFYSNVFYIIRKSACKYKSSSQNTAIVLFTFMSTGIFIEVISGIRCMLAFSIVAKCIFREIEENRSMIKNILWYIVAGLMHSSALVLIILRCGFVLFQSSKNIKSKIINIILVLGLLCIGAYFGREYLVEMIDMAINYFKYGEYSYIWEYIIGVISLTLILFFQYISYKFNNNISTINMNKYSIIISLIVVLFCFEYNVFHRFVIFNSIIIIPTMIRTLNNNEIPIRYRVKYKKYLIMLSSIMLLISSSRGNLCSYKFLIY